MSRARLVSEPGSPVPAWSRQPGSVAANRRSGASVLVAEKLALPALPAQQRVGGVTDLRTRRNQKDLSDQEWRRYIEAVDAIAAPGAAAPRYQDFVHLHDRAMTTRTGMGWGVHVMDGMSDGRNFLAWHRAFVLRLEARLQEAMPEFDAIPYWNRVEDPQIPAALADPADLEQWGIRREPGANKPSLPPLWP